MPNPNKSTNQSFSFMKLVNTFILMVFFGIPSVDEYKFSKRSIIQFLIVLFASYILLYVILKSKILV